MTKKYSLREEIYNELESVTDFRVHEDDLNKSTDKIISIIEKRTVDKVKRDYRKSLTPYLKKFPMKEIFPKEMDALDKVRKELNKK